MNRAPLLPGAKLPQRRRVRAESREFYVQVLALRRAGNRVYRAGRETSLFNGVRIGNRALARLAADAAVARARSYDSGTVGAWPADNSGTDGGPLAMGGK